MTGTQTIFLVLGIAAWLLLLPALMSVVGQHPHGDVDIFSGLRWIFAGMLIFAMWISMAGLLLVAGSQDVLPGWVQIAAFVLCPAWGVAAGAALYLVSETDQPWMLATPLVAPPLVAAYVIALYRPSLRVLASGLPASLAVWGVVLVLAAAIVPAIASHSRERALQRVAAAQAREEYEVRERARKRAENLEKLKAMPPNRELGYWFDLVADDSGVRAEAIEALKKEDRRQADMVVYLENGIPAAMRLAPELDLRPTPELCAAAQTYLLSQAKSLRFRGDPTPYEKQYAVDWAVPAVRWLEANGCDCSAGVAALEKAVGKYLDSPDRQSALAELAGLKH